MIAPFTRVELCDLSRGEYNGRIGIVAGEQQNGRLPVRLAKGAILSLKPSNLKPFPTPMIGLILVGCTDDAGISFIQHVMSVRNELLLNSQGAFLAFLAMVGPKGAPHPTRKLSKSFLTPSADAPHGGLPDASLTLASEGADGLARCPGYRGTSGSYRRLLPALSLASCPSMVVVDLSEGSVAAKLLNDSDEFRIERYGGICVSRSTTSPPEETLRSVLDAYTGWLPPLVLQPPPRLLERCASCGSPADSAVTALVCGRCEAVCYCSKACQLRDLTETEHLSHAAYCKHFREYRKTDVRVSLPGDSSWLGVAMHHQGSVQNECDLLSRIDVHRAPYNLFCPCVPDMDPKPRPLEWQLALVAELSASFHPPAAEVESPPVHPLSSWADYYAFRGVSPSSRIGLLLSFALTTYWAIVQSGALDVPDPIVVHYIGAASREAALSETFRELAALLPNRRVQLIMIGPSQPKALLPETRFEGGAGGWVDMSWHCGQYHELMNLPKASVAVAPNSGIHEYEEWQPCIATLDEAHVPFFFTDYSEPGLLAAEIAIREQNGLKLSGAGATLNPFRQPMDRGLIVGGKSFSIPWVGNGFIASLLPQQELKAVDVQ